MVRGKTERIVEIQSVAWVLTDETRPIDDDDDNGWSLVGIYSSRENALKDLEFVIIGTEQFHTLEWEHSKDNPDFQEAFGNNGRRYILTTAIVDGNQELWEEWEKPIVQSPCEFYDEVTKRPDVDAIMRKLAE